MDIRVIFDFVLAIVTLAMGGTSLMFYKQTKRLKNSDATKAELEAIKMTFTMQIDTLKDQVKGLQDRIRELENTEHTLRSDKNTLEIKHALNKACINLAYGCKGAEECPVIKRRNENEAAHAVTLIQNRK